MFSKTHINCDLGEGIGDETMILPFINACSIACGGHYGNEQTIHSSLTLALNNRVMAGAHPSYPDLENFGRQSMEMEKEVFIKSIKQQLEMFYETYIVVAAEKIPPHIKAHGALYNDLCTNARLVDWFLEALKTIPYRELYTPENGCLFKEAKKQGIPLKKEAFLDRRYHSNGFLASRSETGSVISNDQEVVEQLLNHLKTGSFICLNGEVIQLAADTYCLHGDHPNTIKRLQLIQDIFS